jgi:hypothetical protein
MPAMITMSTSWGECGASFFGTAFHSQQFYYRIVARRLYRVCSELKGKIWLAWNYDKFEGCDIATQLGWVDTGSFYEHARRSGLWSQKTGAKGFLEGLLADEGFGFGGKYEVHESPNYRNKKWFAFSLKGSTAPSTTPKGQWNPDGGTSNARRLSLREQSPTRRVRVSTGGAPERPPVPSVLPDAPVGGKVTYKRDRPATASKLHGVEAVNVMVDDLRKRRRKPSEHELLASLEVVNAARGSSNLAELRASNNKPVVVAVMTTTRGDGAVSSLSK